ncbi:voltage-gated potassium channel [Desulfoluna spongiiphila]|uniref:Voltage-gated potassium channel n=2 Tax=Desulfoluna spongiiphila TaxID=419481 RepID=A0A1G5I3G4_9BACT|nr:voltage-gated potassium channel [Desulfoluna spongiiphila]VVS92681.1 regulator of k+ conductance n-terminal [Desulfoluna spongiiphila]
MEGLKQVVISVILLMLIITVGIGGFMTIEGWGITDAAYMTLITITTVGFGEIHPLSPVGRHFTMVIIVLGTSFFIYVGGSVVQFMVEGQIQTLMGRRKLDKKITRLRDHHIICGYGRIGRVLYHQLMATNPMDIVVIEKSPELVPHMEADGALYISGDAALEENLIRAGIKKASCLVAALATDTDNVFLVLTARQLNPEIFIMARCCYKESRSKLITAGANMVESPYDMGAANMALKLIRPTVTNFLELALQDRNKDIQMEEIVIHDDSELVNVMLRDSGIRQRFDLIIIAIKTREGTMLFNPSFETVLKPGDTVIAVGKGTSLTGLQAALQP